MITIPNCPYCLESIQKLKVLKERNPLMKMEFIVCSDKKSDLTNYKIESKNKFKIKPQILWSNSPFGVRAIDFFRKSD